MKSIAELRETNVDCRTYYNSLDQDDIRVRMQREAHRKAHPQDFRVVANEMYRELENLINKQDAENAGILLAAIIDEIDISFDRELFLSALEGDLLC